MKIALVHDYLNEAGGAERVLRVLADMYPEAPIYTAFAKNGSARQIFADRTIRVSKWGWFLKIGRLYSYCRFLLPWVWKSVDLTEFDLIITSCSGYIARGFKVKKQAKVIAYCHTPPKWLYGYESPTDGNKKWWGKLYLGIFGPWVRFFDFSSAQRVDVWLANSQEVAKRIRKFYRKEAVVVYPPVEISNSYNSVIPKSRENAYYLTVARVVGAKGLEAAAVAARKVEHKLIVVGEMVGGPGLVRTIKAKGGKWIEMTGRVNDVELANLYEGAAGFLALARDEDFGMTVVEAMAYGTPVLAVNSGGYKETVMDGESGILIASDDPQTVADGMMRLGRTKWDKKKLKAWAGKFDRVRFEKAIRGVVGA